MKKNKILIFNKYIFILLVVFAFLVTGATYSYLAYTYQNNSVIKGNVISVDADLKVELVKGSNTKLVPLSDDGLTNAINGTGGEDVCVDANGNLSCQIYKITLTNKGSKIKYLKGSIELYASDSSSKYTNLSWRELSDLTTVKDGSTVNGMNKSTLVSNLTMKSKEVKTWYIAVYIKEVDGDQTSTDEGKFEGTVTFETSTGDELNNEIAKDAVIDNIQSTYVSSSTGIDFSSNSSDTNGKGVYIRSGTESDSNPIYYYRGEVTHNNVLFADYCWKIVRTTETGGTKLIYNGPRGADNQIEAEEYTNVTNDATYPYVYDSTHKIWVSTNTTGGTTGAITFNVKTAGTYSFMYNVSSEEGYDKAILYKDGTKIGEYSGNTYDEGISLGELTTSNVIKIEYIKNGTGTIDNDCVMFALSKREEKSCNNTGTNTQIGVSEFSQSGNSTAFVGYMYGDVYTLSVKSMSGITKSYDYGNDVTYSNGNYTLTGTIANDWSSIYNTTNGIYNHHYTCFSTSNSCSSVYYVYYTDSSTAFYITLNNGKKVEDALSDSLDNNTTDNTIKTTIDSWYKTNIENTGYTKYLEDTIFCNDRSIYQKNGWDPDGGNTTNYLYFGSYNRMHSTYLPSLTCSRNVDKFTTSTSNGNGKLTYPVGLLTADEVSLSGGTSNANSSYYLYSGLDYWLGTPYSYDRYGSKPFCVYDDGRLGDSGGSAGVRPSISLRSGTEISAGDGSYENPYVVQ